MTGVKGHKSPGFSLTSKAPAAWAEARLKPTSRTDPGLQKVLNVTSIPQERDQKSAGQRPGRRRTFAQRTRRLRPPPQTTPTKRKQEEKMRSQFHAWQNFLRGSTRQTALSGATSGAGVPQKWIKLHEIYGRKISPYSPSYRTHHVSLV